MTSDMPEPTQPLDTQVDPRPVKGAPNGYRNRRARSHRKPAYAPRSALSPPRAYTVEAASEALGLSSYTIRHAIRKGVIPAVMLLNKYLIPFEAIEKLMADAMKRCDAGPPT